MSVIDSYIYKVSDALKKVNWMLVSQVADRILDADRNGRPILTCGNGGSAATAIHFASDLRSIGIPAWDLLSPSKLTQIGNDRGYEWTFASQVPDHALVIAFSCSGTSSNIVGLFSFTNLILFTSDWYKNFDVELTIRVPSDDRDYELVEDIHLVLCHAIKKQLLEGKAL